MNDQKLYVRNDASRLKSILERKGISKQDFLTVMSKSGYRSHNTQVSFIDNTKIQDQIQKLKESIRESVHSSYQQKIVQYAQAAIEGRADKFPKELTEQLKNWESQEMALNALRDRRSNIIKKIEIVRDAFDVTFE